MQQKPKSNDTDIVNPQGSDDEMLSILQKETFAYFIKKVNEKTGLVADKTKLGSPSSIAATGLGLSCYIAGIEREYITRAEAINKTLAVLKFLYNTSQGTEADATGYKGFYYHFLDMQTGKRVWQCELSTIDTAILMAGILNAACYFTSEDKAEVEIRKYAEELYARVDWQWALN